MKSILPAVFLPLAIFSCDGSTTIHKADSNLAAKLPIDVTRIGISEIPNDGRKIEDFKITLTNRLEDPVFLSCSTPSHHSDYIKVRNPKTISYGTNGQKGSFHLSSRGLSGGGASLELKPGENVSFVAPVPVTDSDPNEGEFRFTVTVALDRKQKKQRILYSDTVIHNP